MDTLQRIAEVSAAATAAGINPWLAALTMVGLAHFGWLELGPLPGIDAELGDPAILLAVGAAFLIEQVADKVPALDHLSDLVHLPVKPVAAIALVLAVAAPGDPAGLGDLAVPLGIAAAVVALVAHLGKAGLRAGSTAATAGMANPLLSVVEDLGVVTVIVLAVLLPVVALLLVALAIWIAVKGLVRLVRVLRGRRRRADSAAALLVPLLLGLASPGAAQERSAVERDHALAWGAHHLCAGLFVVGRDLERPPDVVVARDIARFPWFRWEDAFDWEVDWARQRVTVRAPGGLERSAGYHGDQGCVIEEPGRAPLAFTPVDVPSSLPDPRTQAWPTGDAGATGPLPPGADPAALDSVMDEAMGPADQNTRALVVLHEGRIVAERYAEGFGPHTPQISWSQGKSIAAALTGVLVQRGELTLDQPAPVEEWRTDPDDPRRRIRIRDLLHMSSGLDFVNLGVDDPRAFTDENEHFRIYQDDVEVCRHALEQPVDLPPDSLFRYRNSDPLALTCIARRIVESRGEPWLSFPRRALFDRIGIRDAVLETDRFGNFIITGYDFLSAYDWARFGLLHLRDGVWEGQRILPEGWVEFVSMPTPTDPDRNYGGLFWVNAGGALPDVPLDAYWPAGFMGQNTVIVPSLDLVVVRLGPSPGGSNQYLNEVVAGVARALRLAPLPS